MLTVMNEHSRHPFTVRHPMSLGDAVAALFRGKPKKKPLGVDPPALRPPFKTASSDDPSTEARQDSPDTMPDRFTELAGRR
jgi:hypothetical protein